MPEKPSFDLLNRLSKNLDLPNSRSALIESIANKEVPKGWKSWKSWKSTGNNRRRASEAIDKGIDDPAIDASAPKPKL